MEPEVAALMTFNEIPNGVIDGVNDKFSLNNFPTDIMVFKNGLLQKEGDDYYLMYEVGDDVLIVFNSGNFPQVNDNLLVTYTTHEKRYIGGGSIQIGGTALIEATEHYKVKFSAGNAAYVRRKAYRGCMDKIWIKEALLVKNSKTYNQAIWLYKDTFNGLHNEYDLLNYQEALDISTIYIEKYGHAC